MDWIGGEERGCAEERNLLSSDLRRAQRPQEGGREQCSLQIQTSALDAVWNPGKARLGCPRLGTSLARARTYEFLNSGILASHLKLSSP
nr:uncharacterized protein LOC112425275 isoform X3 [Macaca nemestrina]